MNILFVPYINRSGSTFLLNQLDKHPSILACPEADILVDHFLMHPSKKYLYAKEEQNWIQNKLLKDRKFESWSLSLTELAILSNAQNYFDAFYLILSAYKLKIKPNAGWVVFKAERLIDVLPLLIHYETTNFKIEFVALIRDIRAVYFSQNKTKWPDKSKLMSTNPIKITWYWNRFIKQIQKYKNESNLTVIQFENLVTDTNTLLNQILGHLMLPINQQDKTSDYFSRLPEEHKVIHQNILKNPISNKINDWIEQIDKQSLLIIESTTKTYMQEYNYNPVSLKKITIQLVFLYIYYFLKFFPLLFLRKFFYKITHV